MVDWIRENVLIVFLVLIALVIGGVWLADRMPAGSYSNPEEPRPAAGDVSKRTAQIRRLHYKDAGAAVALADAVLAQPAGDAERAQALALLPGVLEYAVYARLNTNEWDAARGYLDRLEKDFPQAPETQNARHSWGEKLAKRWDEAAAGGRDAEAEALFRQAMDGGYGDGFASRLRPYQEHKIRQWEQARGSGNALEAQDRLLEAAAVFPAADLRSPLVERLRQDASWDTKDLSKFAHRLGQQGLKAQALPFYAAVLFRILEQGPETLDPAARNNPALRQAILGDLETRVVEGLLQVAAQIQAGDRALLTAADPLELCQQAERMAREDGLRRQAFLRELDIQRGQFIQAAAPVLGLDLERLGDTNYPAFETLQAAYAGAQRAEKRAGEVLGRLGAELWRIQLADPAFDPWPLVPPAVAGPIREDARCKDESARRDRLIRLAFDRQYPVPLPELEPVRETLMQVLARWGLLSLRDNPASGFANIRTAVRETREQPLRDNTRKALEHYIRGKARVQDFEAIYDLSAFYVSEFGFRDQDEAFRREFLTLLEKTAKALQRKAPMKHIFLLSLVAEFFPEEPAGRKARDEAARLAFETVSRFPTKSSDLPNPPSGLAGLSVANIDNNTEYHLLSFYDGPDPFFARIGPYARGCLVLKDGTYRLAVITTSSEIVPYGETVSLNAETKKSSYRITVQGGSGAPTPYSSIYAGSASGDYRLLRAPGDAGLFRINPKTGAVSAGSP